jgi:hypothetical protein
MASTQIDGGKQIRSATITTTQLSATAALTDGQLATSYTKADGTRAFTGDQSMGSHKLTNVTDGSVASDAATYGQMVALLNGFDQKASCRVATTGSETFTISGGAVTQITGTTVDGVTGAVNDRILIKNAPASTGAGVADSGGAGSTQPANGVYVVTNATTNLTVSRATDADASAEVTGGLTVWVNEGTAVADTQWTLITNDAITLNTTALQFSQTDRNALTFSGGLTKTNNSVKRDDLTGDVTTTSNGNATTIAAAAVTLAKMANLAANSVIANNTGSSATPTALGLTAAATASTAMLRDTNANTKANSVASNIATTATAAGTTTLTVSSAQFQQFTGSTTQTVVLPDATTLVLGQSFIISNQSSGAVQINANGGGAVRTLAALTAGVITLIAAGSAAGTWDPGTTAAATGFTTSNFVTRETPSGSVNGSNTTFTLANTPTAGTEEVFLNGILQEPGAGNDYTISGGTITYLTAPVSGDKIRVNYRK